MNKHPLLMTQQTYTIDQALAAAIQHHLAGELEPAAALYGQILQVMPNHTVALHNLGELACRKRKYEPALELLRKANQLDPNNPNYLNTLSVALLATGRAEEAFDICRRAVELDPNLSNAHSNLGICYADRTDLPASIASFRRAIELDANNACAHDGLGLSLLMSGDLQAGWKEQEWRWSKHDFSAPRFTHLRHWKGEPLADRSIYLYVEQGLGDVVQFCRYVPLLSEMGAKVWLETPTEMGGLLKSLSGAAGLIPVGQPPPPVDFVCPLMSLPLFYGTTLQTIPAKIPYLQPDANLVTQWKPLFDTDRGFKVGLAWAGRPSHANDLNRSTTLAAFAPLAGLKGVSFYSLQKGPPAAQAMQPPAGMTIIDLSSRLENLEITAAVISHLDLVISVDTVLVHLAGATAKPVWTLLPFSPDWRWMLHRTDTPWYPAMRLFRLPRRGDWPSVMAEVGENLKFEI